MRIYNSLSQKKELFSPTKNKVTLYVCGITPYDTTHLGHAFLYVFFDVVVRYLQWKRYEVTYTQNVTDIDDDVLKRAALQKRDWKELGTYWTNRFLDDLKNLNVMMPTHYVKATESIDTIITIIKKLLEKKVAYENNGNVYFDTSTFREYGNLSHFNKDQMLLISKERGADPLDPLKKNPLDFILWSGVAGSRSAGQQSLSNEPSWNSPFGKGRPGWHIECSAMIQQYLGDQIDFHGGGRDLIYPHHESEIAQSESFTDKKPFVSFWMHTAMLMYQGEKMSKSLGNLVMVQDLLKKYPASRIRWALLSHHYRSPWEFAEEELANADTILSSIEKNLAKKQSASHTQKKQIVPERFMEFLEDDFNIPNALLHLEELFKEGSIDTDTLLMCLRILGIEFS